MDLILWRHAEAGDRLDDPQADLERPLSPKGERQARRVADWLNQFLPDSARVLSSPALRCLQTAAPLGRRLLNVRDCDYGIAVTRLTISPCAFRTP